MKRIIIIAVVSFFFGALGQTASLTLPNLFNVFFLPPLVLVFAVHYFRPLEAIVASLICGLIADALGGFAIGSNMAMMLVIAFFLGALNIFSARMYQNELAYYVAAVSFVYRSVLLIVQFIFLGHKTNVFLSQLIFGPVIDALVSVPFYYCLVRVLSLVKAFDQSEYFRNRIGNRQ